jgi:acetyltransferase-like isoleucine patch superfamily enzyme
MVDLVAKLVSYPISIPFRLSCKKIGKSFLIGPGYSFWKCNLNNVTIGDYVQIGSRAWIQTVPLPRKPKPTIEIGDYSSLGRNVTVSAAKKISIGKNCMISYNASLLDHNHGFENIDLPPRLQGIDEPEGIEIGDDCFLGAHSFVLKGVVLGKHCIVGANSVVTSSFPPFSVVAGSPAKKIRSLNNIQ